MNILVSKIRNIGKQSVRGKGTMSINSEFLLGEFMKHLESLNKEKCISLIKEALDNKSISIPNLYENVLAKGLANISSNEKEQEITVWEEHVQSGIVRTAIEMSYPYILEKRDSIGNGDLKAIVFCQEEEYHELGARMITDFLTLLGFNAVFVGANTPKLEAIDAIIDFNPDLVCISVTNYFHLMTLKDLINDLRNVKSRHNIKFKILVGGYAIDNTPSVKEKISPDYYANSFEELKKIRSDLL